MGPGSQSCKYIPGPPGPPGLLEWSLVAAVLRAAGADLGIGGHLSLKGFARGKWGRIQLFETGI